MLRRYHARLRLPDDEAKKRGTGDRDDNKDDGFPEVRNAFMIFGGPSACLSTHQRKRERREVFSVKVAAPRYLNWSREAITFDRDDHPDHVPNPGQYPLVVDPIIGNTRLSKVLMDGGSGLNILYANTLELLELDQSQLRGDATPFHGIVPGKCTRPLGRIDLPVCFGTPSNYY